MYFKSREAAGRLLASQISKKYNRHKTAVVALNDGGVIVGMQIAMALNSVITMLLTEDIVMPRENEALAGITHDGSFSYNHSMTDGEINEMVMEYHNFIEFEKMKRLHEMHAISGNGHLIRRDLIDYHTVILASDGLKDGFTLDLALEYLKPIHVKRLIIATPFASIDAVDHMHIKTDEIFCLNVLREYFDTNHYYEDNHMPAHEAIIETIERVVESWNQPKS
jgi:putative phosphoribosyl transferase